MFNSTAQFEVPVLSGGEKKCVLRYPTDEEWRELYKGRHAVDHMLGRGKVQSDLVGAEAAAMKLFQKIRQDKDGAAFDEAEAAVAIFKLENCDAVSCVREGDDFIVTLRVYLGVVERDSKKLEAYQRVVHRVMMPTQAQLLAYSRGSRPLAIAVRSTIERRRRLEPATELYAQIGAAAAGYAEGSSVPIIHKDGAIERVREEMDALAAGDELDPEV